MSMIRTSGRSRGDAASGRGTKVPVPWQGVLVGAVGAVISLGRLWLGNSSALGENLWAEDGLFALCVQKAGFFSCLVDPFAGYWLFLPRALALPISLAPVEMWAWVANLIAAILAGLVSAAAFFLARRYGLGVI